uniref:Uncharacterized protein n=1 Tax=Panagrolaimus sp. ES5 TaxID=591445 RepID=A0AC34F4W2_9BILA
MRQMSNRPTNGHGNNNQNQNQQQQQQQRNAIITQTSTSLATAPYYSNEQALAAQHSAELAYFEHNRLKTSTNYDILLQSPTLSNSTNSSNFSDGSHTDYTPNGVAAALLQTSVDDSLFASRAAFNAAAVYPNATIKPEPFENYVASAAPPPVSATIDSAYLSREYSTHFNAAAAMNELQALCSLLQQHGFTRYDFIAFCYLTLFDDTFCNQTISLIPQLKHSVLCSWMDFRRGHSNAFLEILQQIK